MICHNIGAALCHGVMLVKENNILTFWSKRFW